MRFQRALPLATLLLMAWWGLAQASVPGPTTSGIHLFAHLDGSATSAEAVSAARSSDLVVAGALQIKNFGPAMKQANPAVRLFAYVNGELSQAKDCATFPSSWYLYDTSGNKVKSGSVGNCAMNPESTDTWQGYNGWVDYVQHLCAQKLAEGPLADGCFVDQISSALNTGFASSLPVDPATNQLYQMSTWMTQMGDIGQSVESFTGKPVIGNSYEGGSRYWGKPTNLINASSMGAFESEHFLNAPATQWTALNCWEKNINMMIDSQAHGKGILVAFKNAPYAAESTWRNYVVASYLLGNNGNAWLEFSTSAHQSYSDLSPTYDLNIGSPLKYASDVTGYETAPGVFERTFTNGIAIVNLSGSTQTITLGGTYLGPSGTPSTQVTLSNANGVVMSAG
jgi:hypothetical protein